MTAATEFAPVRRGDFISSGRIVIAFAAMAAMLLASSAARSAGPGSPPPGGGDAVRFETIPGSTVKRVVLSAKAAERLGIQTTPVSEKRIVRVQMLGGQVVHPLRLQLAQQHAVGGITGFTQVSSQPVAAAVPPDVGPGEVLIRLALSQEEWDRVAQDKPARILPLATRPKTPAEIVAQPFKYPPIVDMKRSMLTVYYVAPNSEQSLSINDRVRVAVELKGSGETHKVVPYSALYYDDKGAPWVYVNTRPLTFERQRVAVGHIERNTATLKDGPALGTPVVSTGAPLLYGAEVIYKY